MTTSDLNWASSSCTLPTVERPVREKEFDELFASSLTRVSRVSATRVALTLTGESLSWAQDLVAREASCCSFFTFDVHAGGGDTMMRIDVPPARAAVLDALVSAAIRAADIDRVRT